MPDVYSKKKRSWIMSRISGADTKPEMVVRKAVHGMGFRYRLHESKLPGKPDIVLPRHKKVIFINGCFWHGHQGCKRSKRPATNIKFWNRKIDATIARDAKVKTELKKLGLQVLTIWQCQTKDPETLIKKLSRFLMTNKRDK